MDNPILQMRQFFAHKSREVSLPEMTAFFKACTPEEKAEFKLAIERWDGKSEFIPSVVTTPLALPPSSLVAQA